MNHDTPLCGDQSTSTPEMRPSEKRTHSVASSVHDGLIRGGDVAKSNLSPRESILSNGERVSILGQAAVCFRGYLTFILNFI